MTDLSHSNIRQVITLGLMSVCLLLLMLPFGAHAQLVPGGDTTTLTFSPRSPQPVQEFTVRVEAYAYDLARSQISWTIDGNAAPEYANTRSVTLTAPPHGETLPIQVRVTEPGGTVHTTSTTVIGHAIDLIVESDTRVPSFYRGRRLPSPGSDVRLIAQPSLFTPAGEPITTGALIYTWHMDDRTIKSGRDMQTLTTTMPRSGELRIGVTVETTDGSVRHTHYQAIEAATPMNVFYEDSPLYGLARNALPGEFTLLQNEISVRAEPYYVARDIFSNAAFGWSIDNTRVANPNADQQTLTLRKAGGGGAAEVTFSVRNLEALSQAAESSFVVHFEN